VLGETGGARVGGGSSERPRLRGWAVASNAGCRDVEPEGDGAGSDSRRAEEMTQGAVWRVMRAQLWLLWDSMCAVA